MAKKLDGQKKSTSSQKNRMGKNELYAKWGRIESIARQGEAEQRKKKD